jgi:ribosomal protein S12 methylthiotransferase accessory factor
MAIRPLAKTLSVSQGKGWSYQLARISAAMEAIELWHAEHVRPRTVHRGVPGSELTLPYRVTRLADPESLVSDATPLDWVDGVGLVTGSPTPVPLRLVAYTPITGASWTPALKWTTNGLASGNSWQEASLHALYEVIERDAVCAMPADDLGTPLDPRSVDDAGCAAMVDQIRSGGALLKIHRIPSRFGIPCFGARVWSADFPVVGLGWGAHSAAEVALSRAITEAAQSRLTAIVGSRDDLPPIYDHVRHSTARAPEPPTPPSPWHEVPASPWNDVTGASTPTFTDVADELRWVCSEVTRVSGCEPLLVDLSTDDDFAVVKVIIPGAAFNSYRIHPMR